MKNVLISLFPALAASLCCLTPVLAILAGTTGYAATFNWMAQYRPLFIGFTIFVLGFAWYQKLKPNMNTNSNQIDCNCETPKTNFMQTKTFLSLVTLLSILLLSFPSYSHLFFSENNNMAIALNKKGEIQKVEFTITGMTCSGCEHHVKTEINKLKGIIEISVSYEKGNAIIKFDPQKTSIKEIENAINGTGYKATNNLFLV